MVLGMIENENKFPDYVTFPRTFEKYKWYNLNYSCYRSSFVFCI